MMSNFGHVEKVTREVGGRTCTFRSKLEYRWAVWCQLRKEQGIIEDWLYEDEKIEVTTKCGDRKYYRPDFTIKTQDGYEFEETKGHFTPKDYTRMRLTAEQYENPLTLIFAGLTDCKSLRTQYNRAVRLEPFLKRVIYNANRDIFKKIEHLFEI